MRQEPHGGNEFRPELHPVVCLAGELEATDDTVKPLCPRIGVDTQHTGLADDVVKADLLIVGHQLDLEPIKLGQTLRAAVANYVELVDGTIPNLKRYLRFTEITNQRHLTGSSTRRAFARFAFSGAMSIVGSSTNPRTA